MENKLERPSQKLPKNVLTKRAFVRAVAVNHQTRRICQASRKVRLTEGVNLEVKFTSFDDNDQELNQVLHQIQFDLL